MMEKQTAGQKFLRRSRALTLTISIPSLSISSSFKSRDGNKRSESVLSLRRSQSTRDVWRHKQWSASAQCLDHGDHVSDLGLGDHEAVSDLGVPGHVRRGDSRRPSNVTSQGSGFGYKLKRSLTVSHILDNINKSFRVRRSESQREIQTTAERKKSRFRRYCFWERSRTQRLSFVNFNSNQFCALQKSSQVAPLIQHLFWAQRK